VQRRSETADSKEIRDSVDVTLVISVLTMFVALFLERSEHSELILRHAILLDGNRTARLASIWTSRTRLEKEIMRHAVQSDDEAVRQAIVEYDEIPPS
jgi:hypothetical protein